MSYFFHNCISLSPTGPNNHDHSNVSINASEDWYDNPSPNHVYYTNDQNQSNSCLPVSNNPDNLDKSDECNDMNDPGWTGEALNKWDMTRVTDMTGMLPITIITYMLRVMKVPL